MNAYEVEIWKGVKHNDIFSHNVTRSELIHARNEADALNKISFLEAKIYYMPNLKIEVSKEFIYSVRKIGTVKIQSFYVYSDGRSPLPIKAAR